MKEQKPLSDILVIEDRKIEREHLVSIFKKKGYSIKSADSIKSAKTLLEKSLYRLALIDLGLADGAGSPVFEMVNESEKVDYILILTGNPSPHLKQRFLDQGAAGYIVKGTKDASSDSLKQQVESILGGPINKN